MDVQRKKLSEATLPRKGEPGYWDHMKKAGALVFGKNKGGNVKKIKSPEYLWELACEYFTEVDETPFKKNDFIKSGPSAGGIVKVEQIRPYSWFGFEEYLLKKGVISKLDDYDLNTEGRYTEFAPVIRRIKEVIRTQKLDGATVGAFNAIIVSRDLGLADTSKIEANIKAKVLSKVDFEQFSPETLAEIAKVSELYEGFSEPEH